MNSPKFEGLCFGFMAFHLRQIVHSLPVCERNFCSLEMFNGTVKRIRKDQGSFAQRNTCIVNPNAMFKILRSAVSGICMCKQKYDCPSAGYN